MKLPCQIINGFGELSVFFGYGVTGIMCGKPNLNFVVNIAPPRMMVLLLGFNSHPCHKGKRF